jgi:hypothetical protein
MPLALGFVTIPSGPESSKIKRLMEIRGGQTTDPHQEQFSEIPKLADVPMHLRYHPATSLEGRSPLDFSGLVQHRQRTDSLMEASVEIGARYPVNPSSTAWESPQFHEAAIQERLALG